jgi:hypothetical protein
MERGVYLPRKMVGETKRCLEDRLQYKGFVARQCEGKSIGSKAGESLKTTPIVSGFQIPIGRVVDR